MLLGSLLMIYSCSEEFLTKEPPGVAAGSVMKTPEGMESLVISVYERIQNGQQSMFGAAMASDFTYAGACSDDCYKGTSAGDQSNFNLLERYEALPNNPYLENRWNACYDGVARANVTLEFLWETQEGASPLTDDRAKSMEGELKLLRAWFHMQANKIFEKIPYVKTSVELGDLAPEDVPNTDAGWSEIEADLQYAIDNLPETKINGEAGRVDKWTALALKAQAFMYQNKPGEAKPLLDQIISSGRFSLAPEFYYNFDMENENNSESIFELQCSTSATAHSAVNGSGCNFHQLGPSSCGGWGFYQPSQWLFEAYQVDDDGLPILNVEDRVTIENDMGLDSEDYFEPTEHPLDPRVDWLIARRGVDFLGWGIHPGNDWIREQPNGGPYMTKIFMHKRHQQVLNLNGSGFYNGNNFRILRYASVLLWRAECAVADGQLDLARDYDNMIRERAKDSTPVMGRCLVYLNITSDSPVDWDQPAANYLIEPYPDVSGLYPFDNAANAMKAIQEETRLEFATQNHRFFDLRRWGILEPVLNAYILHDQSFRSFMGGKTPAVFRDGEDTYWPLPQSQIDLQKGVLTQSSYY